MRPDEVCDLTIALGSARWRDAPSGSVYGLGQFRKGLDCELLVLKRLK